MARQAEPQRPADCSRVNLDDVWEVLYWVHEFECTEAELRSAVRAVGPVTDRVRAHLGK